VTIDLQAAPMRMTSATAGLNLSDSVYERLLRERIIFLGTQVDDDIANKLCAQILLLSAEDPGKDIALYINSPGGSVTAGMAIYDTMQFAPCDIATFGMGLAASMGQFLLTAGTKGKRYALPHARIMMHQPSAGIGGSAADIAIMAEQFVHTKSDYKQRKKKKNSNQNPISVLLERREKPRKSSIN
jgi:ATP-dependent Clp protease protease subunit